MGFICIVLGFVFFSDEIQHSLGYISRIIADFLIIFGLILSIRYLQLVPDYSELNWLQNIRTLMVVNDNGICLYSYMFIKPESDGHSEAIVSGALKSIEAILKEGTKSQTLEKIERGENVYLFDERESVSFVLVADEFMKSIRN